MTPPTLFSHLPRYGGDPILALMDAFSRDPRPDKVSLGIGLYFDEQGRLPVLSSVRQAQEALLRNGGPAPYLPMEGSASYRQAVQELVFGAQHPAVLDGRIATMQSVGGSGALRAGADLLRTQLGCTQVVVPDPTWDNHFALFEGAGYQVGGYPYYDTATAGIAFDAMRRFLATLPARTVVLLHASCHNPTGMDLDAAQWRELAGLFAERNLIPFVDMAYQGFGDGADEDAASIRLLADAGLEFLVANSFSKNFSLYGERAGGLSVVCRDAAAAEAVLGQLKVTVRRSYSTPPAHGAALVGAVLQSPELRALWLQELTTMRQRMRDMRQALHAALVARCGQAHDFGYLLAQRGMFSYTGLSPDQVRRLRERHAVYLVDTGRLCISGLTSAAIDHVADAIAAVLETPAA
ncbi:aspartate/tyrosine/aromatic aminotransferase [Ramlibacter sp. AW1]|uniref:Aminotransferase n=1 Tax=Ramlibacter aurantiacus TaxID=2801330 RepID=A0A936ZL33_9BURK|nr:amino acid aminotransferase [Ramlibacter aurantiacus]MBL0419215.1 aspartate/tyrosine/aromatic aminotransferase [Ramlibacter aurantiacus]